MKLLFFIIKVVVITFFIASCGGKMYVVRSIENDTAILSGKQGNYLTSAKGLKLGQKIALKPTRNKSKANCKPIKP